MWRYLAGMIAGLLIAAGGVLLWRGSGDMRAPLAAAPLPSPATGAGATDLPEPPTASEKTREEKRFSRYDKDKDGAVAREEYLVARRKAFAKLDTNSDGKLTFDEWAVKTETKFSGADADHDGRLTPVEFATTRPVRKAKAAVACPPSKPVADEDDS